MLREFSGRILRISPEPDEPEIRVPMHDHQLISRIKKDNQPSSKTAVAEDIYGTKPTKPCAIYHSQLQNIFGDKPGPMGSQRKTYVHKKLFFY